MGKSELDAIVSRTAGLIAIDVDSLGEFDIREWLLYLRVVRKVEWAAILKHLIKNSEKTTDMINRASYILV